MPVALHYDLQSRQLVRSRTDGRPFLLDTWSAGETRAVTVDALVPTGDPVAPYTVATISGLVLSLTYSVNNSRVTLASTGTFVANLDGSLSGSLTVSSTITLPPNVEYAEAILAADITLASGPVHIETRCPLKNPAAPIPSPTGPPSPYPPSASVAQAVSLANAAEPGLGAPTGTGVIGWLQRTAAGVTTWVTTSAWFRGLANLTDAAAARTYLGLSADAVCDLYANSQTGSDSYNGLSADAPLKTLTALKAACTKVGTGVRVGLARGSYWRDSLDLSGISNVTVQAVGTGGAPVIDGSDVFSGWIKTTGRTSVYQTSISHNLTGTNRITVYENGILLKRVADLSTCDSTEGSFVDAKGSDGSPLNIYVHATDPAHNGTNIDPTTNGRVYEISVRNIALSLGNGPTAIGVETRRAGNNNGSLDAVNRSAVTLSRALALDGTKHNLGLGSGTVSDCIAARADPPTSYELANTAFVAFLNDGTGQSVVFRRCGAILQPPGVSDFYSHGNVHPLASVSYEQCWSLGPSYASGATSTEGGYCRGSAAFPVDQGTISRTLMYSLSTGGVSPLANYGPLSMSDCVLYAEDRNTNNGSSEVFRPQGTAAMSHCAFAAPAGPYPLFTSWMGNGNSSAALTVNYCILFGGANLISVPGGSYAGDYNVFHTQFYSTQIGNTAPNGNGYSTLAAWQAATGQDAHSVYLAAADQTAGNANAFWLAHKNAASGTDLTTVGPAAGDWRINPAARVYGANGTAYVGTFPDGTAIMQAGPQTRRDWNARASAAGTPTAWPNVPASVADARAYVAQPAAWVF